MKALPGRVQRVAAISMSLVAAAAALVVSAQDSERQRPLVFRTGSTFVYVDVYPRHDDRVVEGLRPQDFRVFEDGVLQTVETFEFVRSVANRDVTREEPRTRAEGDRWAADFRNRVFVIFVDIYDMSVESLLIGRQALFSYLEQAMDPSDLFAVATPEQPASDFAFTRSHNGLEYELSRAWTAARDIAQDDMGPIVSPVSPRTPAEERIVGCVPDPAQAGRLIRIERRRRLLLTLESVVNRLGSLRDERKNILLISEGWTVADGAALPGGVTFRNDPPRQLPGRQPFGPRGVGDADIVASGNLAACNVFLRALTSTDLGLSFRSLLRAADAANVSFYPVDIGGLRTYAVTAEARAPDAPVTPLALGRNVQTLRTLADNTNGLAIVDTNNLEGGFRRIAETLTGYYLLGYYSTNNTADGKLRKIEVEVSQPRVSVAARRGYLAPLERPNQPEGRLSTVGGEETARFDEAMARLSRLRDDARIFTYGLASISGLNVVAELSDREIASGRWRDGGAVHVVARHETGETTASGRINAGERAAIVHVPVGSHSTGPWRVAVNVEGATGVLEDRLEIRAEAGTLLGSPTAFRIPASGRSPFPVADFQFRPRLERLRVEWPLLAAIDRRTVRVLDRRGQSLAVGAALTEPEVADRPAFAVELHTAALAAGDYVLEVVAHGRAVTERRLLAFRVVQK